MKKLILLLTFMIFLSGCNKVTNEERELAFKEAATKYYEKYSKGMITPVLDNFDVTIEKLDSANKKVNAGFDLKLLSKCSKESKVTLKLDDKGEITSYTYSLDCDK